MKTSLFQYNKILINIQRGFEVLTRFQSSRQEVL